MSLPGKRVLVLLVVFVLTGTQIHQVQAAKGIPGDQQFGFGTSIDPRGTQIADALRLLADLHPDWLYIPLEWSAYSPAPDSQPDLKPVTAILRFAEEKQIAVVLGLNSAPGWSLTARGPDPQFAARFLLPLVQQYPNTVQALELFPRANTLVGWGSPPDPAAYVALLRAVDQSLRTAGHPVLLVAGGLQPIWTGGGTSHAQDMDDLQFLSGMYAAGGKEWMPVVSIAYSSLVGTPLISPVHSPHPVFRRYEAVRELMIANNHAEGLIWITGLLLPDGSINPDDAKYDRPANQEQWLHQAYYQARSQLYIGVAVLQSLNPPVAGGDHPGVTMLMPDGSLHPFYGTLYELNTQNNLDQVFLKPGKPKDGSLLKHKP